MKGGNRGRLGDRLAIVPPCTSLAPSNRSSLEPCSNTGAGRRNPPTTEGHVRAPSQRCPCHRSATRSHPCPAPARFPVCRRNRPSVLGRPLPAETLGLCRSADAMLFGAVGDPKYDDPTAKVRPEQALLGLRGLPAGREDDRPRGASPRRARDAGPPGTEHHAVRPGDAPAR